MNHYWFSDPTASPETLSLRLRNQHWLDVKKKTPEVKHFLPSSAASVAEMKPEIKIFNQSTMSSCSILVLLIASTKWLDTQVFSQSFLNLLSPNSSTHPDFIHLHSEIPNCSAHSKRSACSRSLLESWFPSASIASPKNPMRGWIWSPKLKCVYIIIYIYLFKCRFDFWSSLFNRNVFIFNVIFQVSMKIMIMMFFRQFPGNVDAHMFVFFFKLLFNMISDDLPCSSISRSSQTVYVSLL